MTECDIGTYAAEGAAVCGVCPGGTYSDVRGGFCVVFAVKPLNTATCFLVVKKNC